MPLTMLAFASLDTGSAPRYRSKKACVKTGESTVPTCNLCNCDEWPQGFLSYLASRKSTTLYFIIVSKAGRRTPDYTRWQAWLAGVRKWTVHLKIVLTRQ